MTIVGIKYFLNVDDCGASVFIEMSEKPGFDDRVAPASNWKTNPGHEH